MVIFPPTIDISGYTNSNGEFTEEGSKKLKLDAQKFYENADSHREQDNASYRSIIEKINFLLREGTKDAYDKIGAIINEYEFKKLSKLYYTLKLFQTSYAIYYVEAKSGMNPTIYNTIKSVEDYENIRLSALYLFRRIEMLCPIDDVTYIFEELLNKNVSFFFYIQMLKDLNVAYKSFIAGKLAEMYAKYGKDFDSGIIKQISQSEFKDKKPPVLFDCSNKEYDQIMSRKICFITCVNNERMYEEALYYISRLLKPKGTTVETIAIREADSMTSGYNAAMESSDADIRVYLHQDVCILNPYFLVELIRVFDSNDKIGIVGIVGAPKMPPDAVMWHARRLGNLYSSDISSLDYEDPKKTGLKLYSVEAVDGLLIATNKDIKWREDLFDAWDFYDASISAEYKKRGYMVVVPEQPSPWVVHDDGLMNLCNYNKYRNIYLEEYCPE